MGTKDALNFILEGGVVRRGLGLGESWAAAWSGVLDVCLQRAKEAGRSTDVA